MIRGEGRRDKEEKWERERKKGGRGGEEKGEERGDGGGSYDSLGRQLINLQYSKTNPENR